MKTKHWLISLAAVGLFFIIFAYQNCGDSSLQDQRAELKVVQVDHLIPKRFHIQSGIITFKTEYFSNVDMKGTPTKVVNETLYFDEWGLRTARYFNTEGNYQEKTKEGEWQTRSFKTNHVRIQNNGRQIQFDADKKTGSDTEDPTVAKLEASMGKKNPEWIDQNKEEFYGLTSGGLDKIVGSETILGRPCDIIETRFNQNDVHRAYR